MTPEIRQTLGKFLQKKRKAAHFTQKEAAKFIGYSSAQNITNIEHGITGIPLNKIPALARLYKFDLTEFAKLVTRLQTKELEGKLGKRVHATGIRFVAKTKNRSNPRKGDSPSRRDTTYSRKSQIKETRRNAAKGRT